MSDREKDTSADMSVELGQETPSESQELREEEIQAIPGGWSPGPPVPDPPSLPGGPEGHSWAVCWEPGSRYSAPVKDPLAQDQYDCKVGVVVVKEGKREKEVGGVMEAAAESLFKSLEQIPDPRRARGVRHPFQAIVRLTLLGLVSGQTTMAHIALFGKLHWPELKEPLGFVRESAPHATTISRVLAGVPFERLMP